MPAARSARIVSTSASTIARRGNGIAPAAARTIGFALPERFDAIVQWSAFA
ncbi:MAG: hypothetical protein O9345_17935 [Burkholderiaceae bacterium]|nr:hypothetical protein [Burkholderiaceae bacterium]